VLQKPLRLSHDNSRKHDCHGIRLWGFKGRSHLGERVAALRQAQGPWDLWLAKESEGDPSPFIYLQNRPYFCKNKTPLAFLKSFYYIKKKDF
jgi:hypothetical protein